MLRSAAKNYRSVTVLTDPGDYGPVLDEIQSQGDTCEATRLRLARKVFEHTAAYDALIADYLGKVDTSGEEPGLLTLSYERVATLRYGENPHQQAGLLPRSASGGRFFDRSGALNGKELSYNNIADTDAAIGVLREFSQPTVVAVKHANPLRRRLRRPGNGLEEGPMRLIRSRSTAGSSPVTAWWTNLLSRRPKGCSSR